MSKKLRWHVLDDSGNDDCTLDSFTTKSEALAFVKESLNNPEDADESLYLYDDNKGRVVETYYATTAQIAAKREQQSAEKASLQETYAKEMLDRESGFHWTQGWFFKRMPDGSVRVTKLDKHKNVTVRASIPPPEWASIVCSTSKGGETAERWEEAQKFHGRE